MFKLIALITLFSVSATAADVVSFKTKKKNCNTQEDYVGLSNYKDMYQLTNPTIVDAGRTIELTVELSFYNCEKKDSETYGLVLSEDHMNEEYMITRLSNPAVFITREDRSKKILVLDEKQRTIANAKINSQKNTQSITLEIPKPFLSDTTTKGVFSTHIILQSNSRYYTDSYDTGFGNVNLGSYLLKLKLF